MKEKGWKKFIALCHQEQSEYQLSEFLKFFLTPEEQDQLAQRILLIEELLKDELTQREISKELTVSIAKITRGSNNLKTVDAKMRTYLYKKLTQNEH